MCPPSLPPYPHPSPPSVSFVTRRTRAALSLPIRYRGRVSMWMCMCVYMYAYPACSWSKSNLITLAASQGFYRESIIHVDISFTCLWVWMWRLVGRFGWNTNKIEIIITIRESLTRDIVIHNHNYIHTRQCHCRSLTTHPLPMGATRIWIKFPNREALTYTCARYVDIRRVWWGTNQVRACVHALNGDRMFSGVTCHKEMAIDFGWLSESRLSNEKHRSCTCGGEGEGSRGAGTGGERFSNSVDARLHDIS